MNQDQFAEITDSSGSIINLSEMSDRSDRTLIWGYDTNRNSFHVYFMDNVLCVYCYQYTENYPTENLKTLYYEEFVESVCGNICVPNKRVYPDACDYEFCKLLKNHGVQIPFTTFSDRRPKAQYHGCLHKR